MLLLSEFAGAAQSLISAVRVNPWNTDELADAMHHALTMKEAERWKRHSNMCVFAIIFFGYSILLFANIFCRLSMRAVR